MTIQKILMILIILFFARSISHGQNYFYTLNQFSPLVFNPANVATDNDASFSFFNRRTEVAPGLSYQHNSINGEYPFVNKVTGKRYAGVGISFLEKNTGNSDVLKTHELTLSLAYNLSLAHDQYISFGLQPGYFNKRASLENLTTGSQWIANEFRFDPNAALGESMSENRISYFGFNAGMMWYLEDKEYKTPKAFAGLTAYNLNKPKDSFFEESKKGLPVSYLVHAGGVVFNNKKVQLIPQLVYQLENYQNAVNILMSSRFFFKNENPYDILKSGSIEILNKYDFKKDLSLGFVFHQPGISLGFNYNFPIAVKASDKYFQNAFEIGIKLNKTIWKPKTTTIVIENSTTESKRSFNFNNSNNNNGSTPQAQPKKEVEIVQEKIEEYSKVKSAHIQLQLDKDFKFSFGRTDLNNEAKSFLDEIYKLLVDNPEYKLEVIGHTDNVGKPFVNYRLSVGRAQAVAGYLKQKGISDDRIKFSGKGDTEPVAPNDSEDNRTKNRRVQFIIYVNR